MHAIVLEERDSVMVEHLTPNQEVLGLNPTGGTVLCFVMFFLAHLSRQAHKVSL